MEHGWSCAIWAHRYLADRGSGSGLILDVLVGKKPLLRRVGEAMALPLGKRDAEHLIDEADEFVATQIVVRQYHAEPPQHPDSAGAMPSLLKSTEQQPGCSTALLLSAFAPPAAAG